MTRYHVLLHAPFWGTLRSRPPDERLRFRRVVENLAAGRWDGGTRVKKLRGTARPVFEARYDDGFRVLFTMAHSAWAANAEKLLPHLQVWDLVHHDRVSGKASRINPSAEAEFLDFEEIESEVVTGPPPRPSATFADVPSSEPGGEVGVVDLMLAEAETASRAREGIAGGVRWYVVPDLLLVDESRWQDLFDRGLDELELKLTAEQYEVVRAPGPVLLSGSAGSGKTTIAVHRLAAATAAAPDARALYVTYSGWLLDHARRLFRDLLACRGVEHAASPEFLTVRDLYRAILAEGGIRPPDRLVDFPEFARWYRTSFRLDDAALAWEEIRSIVKGASLDPATAVLPRGEYEALGRKRAPLFAAERGRLHRVARRWQEHLEASGLADEIDLCRLALGSLGAFRPYDVLVCDEAQDLAEIQVELLLRLCPSMSGLFLAGDPQQVINPSGFRWAEVRSRIRDRFLARARAAPEIRTLTRNFRSVRGLVDLANEVIAFKRDRTGRSDGDETEEAALAGATPIRVVGGADAMAEAVRGFGPRCAVVAGSDEACARVREILGTTRVFTVPEAKGLEFDVAVLWEVVSADPGPWNRLLDPSADLREDPACRRALHHLYVAVTRARRHLAVWEPEGAPPLWTSPRFASRLDEEEPSFLERLFARSASPDEWAREGEYFLERGRHRQAAECFRRAGDARREAEARAAHHEAAGEFAEAAESWRSLGERERAAVCFEAAGDHGAAAGEWLAAGREDKARRASAKAAESDRRFREAAEAWEALASWQDAARCWEGAGDRAKQNRALGVAAEEAGRFADAARRFGDAGDHERAAQAWRKAGRERDASLAEAKTFEDARRFAEAARAWEAGGDASRALRCRALDANSSGRFEEAAAAWERLGETAEAVRAWKRAGRPEEARKTTAKRDLAEGRFVRAAEAFEDLVDYASAAEAWGRAAAEGQEPTRSEPLPLPQASLEPWAKGERAARLAGASGRRVRRTSRVVSAVRDARTRGLVCAVRAAEDAGRFEEAAAPWKGLGDRGQELRCLVTAFEGSGRFAESAALFERRGKYELAAERWERIGETAAAVRCRALRAEKRHRPEEAERLWRSIGENVRAEECRARSLFQRGDYEGAAAAFEETGDLTGAVVSRVMLAKLRLDYDGAERALRDAKMLHLRSRLLGPRKRWLEEAKAMVRQREPAPIRERRAARVRQRSFDFDRDRRETAQAEDRSPAENALAAVVQVVRRHPGLTSEQIGKICRLDPDRVKPILRDLVEAGVVAKSGRTRGTRYYPR